MTKGILHRLRCSSDQIEQAAALVANHMRFKDAPRMKQSTLKRFLRLPHFEEHMELHRLDCLSSHGSLQNYEFVKETLAATPEEHLKPGRLITGADLITMGLTPGPAFSRILTAIEDAQLEGAVTTREEALALARSYQPGAESPHPAK
jgi:poly(A) polymerase